ncbi:MAG: sterol desaturase family protein [Pseudomonadales bacterium]
MDLVTLAIPAFVLLMLLEYAYGVVRGNDTYRLNDTVNSLSLGSLRTLGKLVFFDASVRLFGAIADTLSIIQWPAVWWMWLAGFVAYDFCYYWFHRISHERSLFWASHVAHHQSEEFNLSTALRQTGTGFLCSWVFFVPLFLFGCPPDMFYTIAAVNLLYQFWVHTEHIGRLGALDRILVTPSNHRVHHASNRRYMDRNYGGVFILWDRFFGSFCDESSEEACRFGISQPLNSWNPLWANLHVYADMWHAARRQPWQTKTSVLLASPAALHSMLDETTVRVEKAGQTLNINADGKYHPSITASVKVYVAVQFLLALALASYLSFEAVKLDATQLWLGFLFCLLAYTALGLMLENRRLGYILETVRLATILSCSLLPGFAMTYDLALTLLSLLSGLWLVSLARNEDNRLNVVNLRE